MSTLFQDKIEDPEETTQDPEETTEDSEETTEDPEETTVDPEETTEDPEEITHYPEETTQEGQTINETTYEVSINVSNDSLYSSANYAYYTGLFFSSIANGLFIGVVIGLIAYAIKALKNLAKGDYVE